MTDPKQIAARLTEEDRELLLDNHGFCRDSYAPATKLVEAGLANRRYTSQGSHRLVWTTLGLAVRAILTEQQP